MEQFIDDDDVDIEFLDIFHQVLHEDLSNKNSNGDIENDNSINNSSYNSSSINSSNNNSNSNSLNNEDLDLDLDLDSSFINNDSIDNNLNNDIIIHNNCNNKNIDNDSNNNNIHNDINNNHNTNNTIVYKIRPVPLPPPEPSPTISQTLTINNTSTIEQQQSIVIKKPSQPFIKPPSLPKKPPQSPSKINNSIFYTINNNNIDNNNNYNNNNNNNNNYSNNNNNNNNIYSYKPLSKIDTQVIQSRIDYSSHQKLNKNINADQWIHSPPKPNNNNSKFSNSKSRKFEEFVYAEEDYLKEDPSFFSPPSQQIQSSPIKQTQSLHKTISSPKISTNPPQTAQTQFQSSRIIHQTSAFGFNKYSSSNNNNNINSDIDFSPNKKMKTTTTTTTTSSTAKPSFKYESVISGKLFKEENHDNSNNSDRINISNKIKTNKLKSPTGYKTIDNAFNIEQLRKRINSLNISVMVWGVLFDNDRTNYRDHKESNSKKDHKFEYPESLAYSFIIIYSNNNNSTFTQEEDHDDDYVQPTTSTKRSFSSLSQSSSSSVSSTSTYLNEIPDSYQIEKYYITIYNEEGGPIYQKLLLMKDILENPNIKKVSYNCSDGLKPFIKVFTYMKPLNNFDIKIAAWLLDSSNSYSFDSVTEKYSDKLNSLNNKTSNSIKSIENQLKLIKYIIEEEQPPSQNTHYQLFSRDNLVCLKSYIIVKNLLFDKDLSYNFVEEMFIVPIISNLEINGILLDTRLLNHYDTLITGKINTTSQDISNLYGIDNPNSNQKISDYLYKRKEQVANPFESIPNYKSVNRKSLLAFKEENSRNDILVDPKVPGLVDSLLIYRKLTKIKSTYIKPFLDLAKDSRVQENEKVFIHCEWLQCGTETGRLASCNPNLQNIVKNVSFSFDDSDDIDDGTQDLFLMNQLENDEDDISNQQQQQHQHQQQQQQHQTEVINIRDSFISRDGYTLIGLDYNQVELRVMAHFSKDKDLVSYFNNNKDVISNMASKLFNKPPDNVSNQERDETKRIVYGIMYGIGSNTLSQLLKISKEEAENHIKKFYAEFNGINRFIKYTKSGLSSIDPSIRTISGRIRKLKDSQNSRFSSAQYDTRSVNSIIQGSAADIVKKAMVNINNFFGKVCSIYNNNNISSNNDNNNSSNNNKNNNISPRLLLQIHDELIFEVPTFLIDQFRIDLQIKYIMESVAKHYNLLVDLKTSLKTGNKWGSLTKVDTIDNYNISEDEFIENLKNQLQNK